MADEKKIDIFAEQTPAGLPAYPQVIYAETGEKHPNNEPIMKVLGIAKNPTHHKELLGKSSKEPAWGNK